MHRFTPYHMVLVFLFVNACCPTSAHAQSDDERTRAAATLENGRLEAVRYVIHSAESDQKQLTLNAESLLRWQNTINKSVHGNIFIWTKDGRPELVSSIYQFYSPKQEFSAEFQSLSLGPLRMEKDGRTVWTPKKPGVVLMPFDGDVAPASLKPQRLRQMRQLAESFQAELKDYNGESYRLRLMSQPLFRYESTDPQVLDGALFSYTYTTDPDLLVVVEARKTNDGYQWMYGLARMNVGELKVSYNNREVFRVDRLERFSQMEGVYTLFMDLSLPGKKDQSQ